MRCSTHTSCHCVIPWGKSSKSENNRRNLEDLSTMVGENFKIYQSEMAIYSSSENNSHFDISAPNTAHPPLF